MATGGFRPIRSTWIPASIVGFVNQASAKYPDFLRRQAFSSVSLASFIHAESAERDYLGRIAQGFFGFHAMGVFGDAASERLQHLKETVWLVDSNVQITALAIGSVAHPAFSEALENLSGLGLRFFSSDGLFEETKQHLWFANKIVDDYGASSPDVINAARGDAPYRKANLFLEGFINWQAAGNPTDWQKYLIAVGGLGHTGTDTVRSGLEKVNICPVAFQDWPGFKQEHLAEAEKLTNEIIDMSERRFAEGHSVDPDDLRRKAKPEAEALLIIEHERDGQYHMLSGKDIHSSAWFLSQTALLNKLHQKSKITWHPEAFLRFANTVAPVADSDAAENAFNTLLWTIAQSGVTVLDDRVAVKVFGGIIDEARLTIAEQRGAYDQVLENKYGSLDQLLAQVKPLDSPLVALQLANERAERESAMRMAAQRSAAEESKRAAKAEAELESLKRFRQKLQMKQNQAKERKRKGRSQKKGKKGKKK
jgi:hypothetical protein